jgi:hypothetical protein
MTVRKQPLRRAAWGLFVVAAVLSGLGCPPGNLRPGSTRDGSARWAVDLAQPRITAFAADAQLRTIVGARIAPDGRVFASVGSWSVTAYSPSRHQKIEVQIAASGSVSDSTSPSTGEGIQVPLPASWLNSTEVFARVRNLVPAFDEATLVTFNLTDFGAELAHKATWGINTPGGNVLVQFDGSVARLQ